LVYIDDPNIIEYEEDIE
jgi:hypothetical protein